MVENHAEDNEALQRAARNGHLEFVQFLVQNGKKRQSCKGEVLRHAAENNH
jgi:hypothetical protein